MPTEYLMPAAHCPSTGDRVKRQDLSGRRFTRSNQTEAWLTAQVLAEDLTARTRETWIPELITYTV